MYVPWKEDYLPHEREEEGEQRLLHRSEKGDVTRADTNRSLRAEKTEDRQNIFDA